MTPLKDLKIFITFQIGLQTFIALKFGAKIAPASDKWNCNKIPPVALKTFMTPIDGQKRFITTLTGLEISMAPKMGVKYFTAPQIAPPPWQV